MAKVTLTFTDISEDEGILVEAAIEPKPSSAEQVTPAVHLAMKVRRWLDMDEKLHNLICPDCSSHEELPETKGRA